MTARTFENTGPLVDMNARLWPQNFDGNLFLCSQS